MNEELNKLQEKLNEKVKDVNKKIEIIGKFGTLLDGSINEIQKQFNLIRGIPFKQKQICDDVKKIRSNLENAVKQIEQVFDSKNSRTVVSAGAGVALGAGVVALGPTAAMGIATTYGVASTGVAISSLSGAAATQAALAWLGGGTLASGGAGVAGGKFLLALAGPIGWGIAGISLLVSGILIYRGIQEKKRVEQITSLVLEKQIKQHELAIAEMNERLSRMKKECQNIDTALLELKTFGLDYDSMNMDQKYKLGSFVNAMYAATQLLVNPIMGLKPNYGEEEFARFLGKQRNSYDYDLYVKRKDIIIYFANQYYGLDLSTEDYHLMWKLHRRCKEELAAFNISKEDFSESIFYGVRNALWDLE